ncbi:MAG: hypothetical protein ACOVLC_13470 [Flavobacterium sp.]
MKSFFSKVCQELPLVALPTQEKIRISSQKDFRFNRGYKKSYQIKISGNQKEKSRNRPYYLQKPNKESNTFVAINNHYR